MQTDSPGLLAPSLFGRPVLSAPESVLGDSVLSMAPGEVALFCNVHMLMASMTDGSLAAAMDSSDYVFPDGVPIAWLQRRLGFPQSAVLRGYQAVRLLCRQCSERGEPVGFIGATEAVLDKLCSRLTADYPGLEIGLAHAPPLLPGDPPLDPEIVRLVEKNPVRFLFVGLGCPKQEKWAARHAAELNCSLLAVGAAFDWIAGTTPMPPGWMQRAGLGWLHRLAVDPGRMWKRYLKYNSRFIIETARLLGARYIRSPGAGGPKS